ncbi:MAG TPA: FAD-binding protein [Microlunatus sp.]
MTTPSQGNAAGSPAPELISKIIFDEDVCRSVAEDYGGYRHCIPQGVIRAESVNDVVAAMRFAGQRNLQVAARGSAHSTHGQSQVDNGLVIDLRGLNRVADLTPDSLLVQAGALWRDVAHAALSIGRTFPVFTDYLGTTVGGTLSAGGVGSRTWQLGAQTDHVLELEVVTADGDVKRCSPYEHRKLFDAARCGLGQFGIITSARLQLAAAPARAHYHKALYDDVETFFTSLNAVMDEGTVDGIQGFALGNDPQSITAHVGPDAAAFVPPSGTGSWVFCMETVRLVDETVDLATTAPTRSDWLPNGLFSADLPYLQYIDRLGPVEDTLTQLGMWQLPHPMLDLLLPGSQALTFLVALLRSVDPADVAGPVLIYPYRRETLRTPLFRAPEGPTVVLVGLMRTTVPANPERVRGQLDQNRRLYEAAVDHGGCYYPVDSVAMDSADWERQFGDQWAELAEAKHLFDPQHLLNPGQAIFRSR